MTYTIPQLLTQHFSSLLFSLSSLKKINPCELFCSQTLSLHLNIIWTHIYVLHYNRNNTVSTVEYAW